MSAARYRKKPVVIEAMQVPPADDLLAWGELAGWLIVDMADIELTGPSDGVGVGGLVIHTLEGDMTASIGGWVIKGVAGEFYPCKPDIFAATYEPVDLGRTLDRLDDLTGGIDTPAATDLRTSGEALLDGDQP